MTIGRIWDAGADTQSRAVGAVRSAGEFSDGCCARRFVAAPRTRPRSDSARSRWWGSRQTAHAWVWAATIAAPFYGHSDGPKSSRSCREEIPPTRRAAENPASLPRSCAAPPSPHHARGEGRKRPTTGRCHSVDSGWDGGRLCDTNSVRRAVSSAADPSRPGRRPPRRGAGCDTALRCGFFYLELRIAAFTPGLPGPKPQPRFPQPAPDRRPRQMLRRRPSPQILLQFGQRPSGKTQTEVGGAGRGHLQDLGGLLPAIFPRPARLGTVPKSSDPRSQESLHPTVGIGVMKPRPLTGLGQRNAGRQMPDQLSSFVQPRRREPGPQQALQLPQLFTRQMWERNASRHASRVA